nr:chromate transporter [uncultured Oscillibacter sp.]
MIYLHLFWEFMKIGLFAVGGGMATLPFLQRLSESTGWYSQSLITDMIAISESTPGPIGINMATYVGYSVAGVFGGIAATIGEVLPAVVVVVIVSKYLEIFQESVLVSDAFYGLRPAVTGLIAAAGLRVMQTSLFRAELFRQTGFIPDFFDFRKLLYFALVFIAVRKWKKHPVIYIAGSAAAGIILAF